MEYDAIPFDRLLEKVVDNRGRTCPVSRFGRPLIATNCIRNESLYPLYDTVRFVSEDTYESWFRGHPEPGDMIFVTKGSPGQVCWVPEPVDFCIAQDMVAIRTNQDLVYPKYLFALLRSRATQESIGRMHVGSLIPHFKKGDFDKLNLPIPRSREHQRFVGDFYFFMSQKVDLSRRICETLESMAQALFNSWFVDFDPVRAKAEGQQPAGLGAEAAALFSSSFDESELGAIPTGWQVLPLGDVIELKRGYDLPASQRVDGAVPVVSSSGISGRHSESKVPGPGIVTGRYGTIGQVFFIRRDFWPLNTTLYVKDLKGNDPLFAYHLLRRLDFGKFSDKAAVPGINRNHVHEEPVIVPPRPLQRLFAESVGKWDDLGETLRSESALLTQIRDALLPRLLSGELRVPEAQRLAEAVV